MLTPHFKEILSNKSSRPIDRAVLSLSVCLLERICGILFPVDEIYLREDEIYLREADLGQRQRKSLLPLFLFYFFP